MASRPPLKVVILCLIVLSVSPFFFLYLSSHHMNIVGSTTDRIPHQLLQNRKIAKEDEQMYSSRLQVGLPEAAQVVFFDLSRQADIGQYLVDVFIGTPPVLLSMILDTSSDLTWVNCRFRPSSSRSFNANVSRSFQRIRRNDPRCGLLEESLDSSNGEETFCRYYYSYEELYTTGDLATETFTLNITSASNSDTGSETIKVENVIFGCSDDSNQLLGYNPFTVASGILGLGGGRLSFVTQLQPFSGHSFAYCLTSAHSTANKTSPTRLLLGRSSDSQLELYPRDPTSLNFTSFLSKNVPNLDSTYYYVQIRSIVVGGQVLDIPNESWGGTIIDSGATISVFPHHVHQIIKEAFLRKVMKYQLVVKEEENDDEEELSPCYKVSRFDVENLEIPEFGIVFGDGAVWNFPVENYFMGFEDNVVCFAIRGVKNPRFSIIGNFQQQNFHMLFDTKEGRLGFAPARCADRYNDT